MKLKYNKNIRVIPFNTLDNLANTLQKEIPSGNIGLSGGSTYLKLLKIWAENDLNLKDTNFYPVDERVVDFDSTDSNWGNTYRNFLSNYNKNRENHFVDSEKYNEILKDLKMDTIFLGVGDDGHTASLFSCDDVFKYENKNVIQTISPKPPFERVSMTGKYIVSADNIIIIFYGTGKDTIFDKVFKGDDLPITTLLKKVNKGVIYVHEPLIGETK